jgi:hypothetical protein
MENDSANTGNDKAPETSPPKLHNNQPHKGKKWSLKRHWDVATRKQQVKWVVSGIGSLIALGGLGSYIWSNLQTKWNFQQEQRPRLVITKLEIMDLLVSHEAKEKQEFKVGEPMAVNVEFKNIGKTTAYHFIAHYHLLFGKDVNRIKSEPMDQSRGGTTIDAGAEATVSPISVRNTYTRESPSVKIADIINWDGSDPVIVFGRLAYTDEAGVLYCRPFIYEYIPGNWMVLANEGDVTVEELCPSGKQ